MSTYVYVYLSLYIYMALWVCVTHGMHTQRRGLAATGWARALARERATALRTARTRVLVERAGHAVAAQTRTH